MDWGAVVRVVWIAVGIGSLAYILIDSVLMFRRETAKMRKQLEADQDAASEQKRRRESLVQSADQRGRGG